MFLPQEAGLFEHKNAISVKKGCYLGQEIVARLHFLGQAKKTLQGFYYPEKINIALLDEVMQNDKKIGAVVSHASHNNKTWLLCIINKQAFEDTQTPLKLSKHPEPLVHIKRPS
jgi:folate-binding protein YgfZ